MLENKIEKELKSQVKKIGGKAYKFSSPGNNGVPDRIVLYKGQCYFVELKKPGEDLRPLQKVVKKRFRELGFEVYVIDSIEKVGEFINEIYTP
ncbi:VRR-NUC domain-containing protein [Tissierella praeacuta]|uniref:VRR-NUC domain-containing protein n=1 Tax=Tissierella praeacuta TaxID=43131 RepID=UPI002FDA2C55